MLTLVEAMKMLTDEEEGADSEAVEVVFAEIDRLRAELGAHVVVIAATSNARDDALTKINHLRQELVWERAKVQEAIAVSQTYMRERDEANTEVDRLRAELRKMREANPPLIAAVTSDLYNKEMARWQAETDRLCGPKKGVNDAPDGP